MAFRLGEYVVYGELQNRGHYMTCGIIVLRGEAVGQETVVRLDLTGDCERDLQGKHFRFRPGDDDTSDAVFRMDVFPSFQIMQIGPTGTMTAQGWVRTLPCPVEEYMRRADLGESPPTPWKRHLYLEWYGQNGRIVVELADAAVEECVREPKGEEDEGQWETLPNLALPPELGDGEPAAGPEITLIRQDGDNVDIETWTPSGPSRAEEDDEGSSGALQRQLDAEAAAIDRALSKSAEEADSGPDIVPDLELMDYCIDHSQRQPPFLLLDDAGPLPPTEALDDEQVEIALKVLLVRLAAIGIALDVCEHFSPRDCYRLLRDKILLEPNAYSELVGTGWAQHVATHDYCAACEAGEATDAEVPLTDADMDDGDLPYEAGGNN